MDDNIIMCIKYKNILYFSSRRNIVQRNIHGQYLQVTRSLKPYRSLFRRQRPTRLNDPSRQSARDRNSPFVGIFLFLRSQFTVRVQNRLYNIIGYLIETINNTHETFGRNQSALYNQ